MKLDDHVVGWIVDWARVWLREVGPPIEGFLAVPTAEWFPDTDVEALLETMKEQSGLSEWSFALDRESELDLGLPISGVPHPAVPSTVLKADDREIAEGEPLPVPIHPNEVDKPAQAINSIAWAFSHYLLHDRLDELPDDDELPAVIELGTVMLGYGVFAANATFELDHFEDGLLSGWSTVARGALGYAGVGYALALYVELASVDPKLALDYLETNPRASYKWARKQLRKRHAGFLEQLREVEAEGFDGGPYR